MRSTSRAGRASRRCSRASPATPLVYYVFDLLEVEGEPLVDLPLEERRARLEKLLDKRNRTSGSRRASTTASAARGCRGAGARGDRRQARRLAVPPGRRTREWLKVKTPRPAGVRDRRLHEGAGASGGTLRLTRARRTGEGGELVYAGNVGTGFNDKEIDAAAREAASRSSVTTPPFREVPKMPRVRKGDVVWVEPEARRRGGVRRVDARRTAAGARRTRGCARTRRR